MAGNETRQIISLSFSLLLHTFSLSLFVPGFPQQPFLFLETKVAKSIEERSLQFVSEVTQGNPCFSKKDLLPTTSNFQLPVHPWSEFIAVVPTTIIMLG